MGTKQLQEPSDFQITEMMIKHGGGFVSKLGMLFRIADDDNKEILKNAFNGYWKKYSGIAESSRCPECGSIDVIRKYHDGLTGGVPECNFNECEDCGHQWGHS